MTTAYPDTIESVFEQVLLVRDKQGLLDNEPIAIDGCKMSSNAAKEHKRLDRRKPKERERKNQWEQSSDTLFKHVKKINRYLKTAAPRMEQGKQAREIKGKTRLLVALTVAERQ